MYLVTKICIHYNGDEDNKDWFCVLKYRSSHVTQFTDSDIWLVYKLLTTIVNMTAVMSAIEHFDVNCDINFQASRWEDYIDRYEDYCLAFNVTDSKRNRALLLHCAGVNVKNIHRTLETHTPGENEDEYTKTRDATNSGCSKENDSIIICVDMMLPNKAFERERHITHTIDDVITELNGA